MQSPWKTALGALQLPNPTLIEGPKPSRSQCFKRTNYRTHILRAHSPIFSAKCLGVIVSLSMRITQQAQPPPRSSLVFISEDGRLRRSPPLRRPNGMLFRLRLNFFGDQCKERTSLRHNRKVCLINILLLRVL